MPLGYRVVYEEIVYKGKKRRVPCKFVEDEETSWIVREIYRRYLLPGESLGTVTAWLNAQGIPPRGRAQLWSTTTVHHILSSEKYLGDAIYGQHVKGKFFTVVNGVSVEREQAGPAKLRSHSEAIVKEAAHEPPLPARHPQTTRSPARPVGGGPTGTASGQPHARRTGGRPGGRPERISPRLPARRRVDRGRRRPGPRDAQRGGRM
jgi:hypothetical protein